MRNIFLLLSVSGYFLLSGGCNKPDYSSHIFRLLSPEETNIHFSNEIQESGIYNMFDFFYLYNGGGVALGDINNDSLPDIFFSGNMVPGRLYLNKGDFEFEDITESAGVLDEGWSTGVNFVDINSDGFLDLYICRSGKAPADQRENRLYVNNGNLTFTEQAEAFGIADTGYSTQSAFFDYDKDGDLDLYLLNHSNKELQPNRIRQLVTDGTGIGNDRLYRNNNDGSFSDVTVQAGIVYPGMGLGVGISDLNNDGWEDIYVANDFLANDYLYLNQKDGTFREVGSSALKHHSLSSMGSDLADIDNDGWVDIVVVDMLSPDYEKRRRMSDPMNYAYFMKSLEAGYHPQYLRNTLQANNGTNVKEELTFSEIGQYAGIEATGWSWAPLLADFDNDGYRDLWITNGYLRGVVDEDLIRRRIYLERRFGKERAQEEIKKMLEKIYSYKRNDVVYHNKGNFSFEEKSTIWKPDIPSFSNGAAYADLNNDGTLDMVVNQINAPAAIYENISGKNGYLRIKLEGPPKNRYGLGTKVKLYCNGEHKLHHHNVSRGYQSSVEYPVHFGLGGCQQVDSLRIIWPDGKTQWMNQVGINQMLTINYKDSAPPRDTHENSVEPLLVDISDELNIEYKHQEEFYNDFARQPLVPHKHSQMGPGVAVGDVNNDGLDDFFVGGAYEQRGALFIQNSDKSFTKKLLTSETSSSFEEDMGALFFDADSDGDQDLYVASGSNEFFQGSRYYQDRLYLNNGSGNFKLATDALPEMRSSSSAVISADYDRDGDLDLFVGGRLQPLAKSHAVGYPLPGDSHILQNDGGEFSDVTDIIAGDLKNAGMVTSGLWTDFDNDGWRDLIVVGEFMEISFFKNKEGKFENITNQTGLKGTNGWWNSIAGGDFDRDGDTDYVAGNLGLNTRFEASPSQPVSVYAKDFDRNGRIDPFVTYFVNGTEYPIHNRDELLAQIPAMRSKFPNYKVYAQTSFIDFFPKEYLENAYIKRAKRFESSYIENMGNGKFKIKSLPGKAQWAPVYGLEINDIDEDQNLDVLAIGNSYTPNVTTGRLDASVGVLLKGDGEGHFKAMPHQRSGFFVNGDGKSLASLFLADGNKFYIATQNNDSIKAFKKLPYHSERSVQAGPLDAYVLITYQDGSTEKRELYYGSGYLSQSTRKFKISGNVKSVILYSFTDEPKIVVQ